MGRRETQELGRGLHGVLMLGVLLGAVTVLGCGYWIAVARTFFPFDLVGGWWVRVFAFLLSGPLALLPGCILALRRPRAGGWFLAIAALISAIAGVWLMTPTPREWSGNHNDPLRFYIHVAKWSLYLLVPVSLPLGLLGAWTLLASRSHGVRSADSAGEVSDPELERK